MLNVVFVCLFLTYLVLFHSHWFMELFFCFVLFYCCFSPQERPVKSLEPQLWSGRHAVLHHHRGERADPIFKLYICKFPPCMSVFTWCMRSLLHRLSPFVLKALKKTGLHPSDPRLKHCMDKFRQASRESVGEVILDRELFHRYNGEVVPQAVTRDINTLLRCICSDISLINNNKK